VGHEPKVVPFPRRAASTDKVTLGGLVDSASVSLSLYGADLEPAVVTQLLGVEPIHAWRRGERPKPRLPPTGMGTWSLAVTGAAPQGPEELLIGLLDRLPADPDVWAEVRRRWKARLFFGLFLDAFNRGFNLGAGTVARVAVLGIPLHFDIYGAGECPLPFPFGDR